MKLSTKYNFSFVIKFVYVWNWRHILSRENIWLPYIDHKIWVSAKIYKKLEDWV